MLRCLSLLNSYGRFHFDVACRRGGRTGPRHRIQNGGTKKTEDERRKPCIRRGRPATQAVVTGQSNTSARAASDMVTVRALVLDRPVPPLRGAASNALLRCLRSLRSSLPNRSLRQLRNLMPSRYADVKRALAERASVAPRGFGSAEASLHRTRKRARNSEFVTAAISAIHCAAAPFFSSAGQLSITVND